MKKLKFKFNNLLRKYLRYTKKSQRFRLTGRNEHRQGVLEKHIQRLERKLYSLQSIIKKGAITGVIASAALLATTGVSAQVSFEVLENNPFEGVDIGTASSPAFADVDNDGDIDVFTGKGGNYSSGDILYFENNGDGTYTQQSGVDDPFNSFTGLGSNAKPAFGDVDGDGFDDMMLGNFVYGENNGDGTFTQLTGVDNPFDGLTAVDGAAPTFIDVDGDLDLDIIRGNENGTFTYLKNNGDSTFTEVTGVENPFDGVDIGSKSAPSFGDFDGDGFKDMISGNSNNSFHYFKNNGDGSFTQLTGVNNPFGELSASGNWSMPVLLDIDEDGDLDLLSGNYNGTLDYFENDGTGSFKLPGFAGLDIGSNSTPSFGDVDGDGDMDMASGNNGADFLYFVNDGNNVFTQLTGANNPFNSFGSNSNYAQNTATSFVDLDGDGNVDMIGAYNFGNFLYIRNNGDGTFTEQTGVDNPLDTFTGNYPSFGDVDGDMDLLNGLNNGMFTYFENNDDGTFTELTGADNPFNGFDVGNAYFDISTPVLLDLDGDGDTDMVSGQANGKFHYFENNGDGTFTEQTGVNNPFDSFDVGTSSAPAFIDTDGDGDMDMVSGDSSGKFTLFINTTPIVLETTTYTTEGWNNEAPDSNTVAIIAADYDTDVLGNIDAASLTVNYNTALIIAADTYVKVESDFVNNGDLTIAHTGSLVQVTDDGVVTNTGDIEVQVTSAVLNARDFMVMGSPVTNATPEGVDNDVFRKIELSTAAFRPHPAVQLLYPDGANFVDEDNNDFAIKSGSFTEAKGYLVWPQPSLTEGGETYPMIFTQDAMQLGTLNTGTITYGLTFNETGTGTGTPAMNKNASPNMISNPYPSAISAQGFINENDAVDEVYFWEHNTSPGDFPGANSANFNMADISVYNDMGFNPASTGSPIAMTEDDVMIATAQGFGIKNNGTATEVSFTNAMRSTTGNTTLRAPEVAVNRLWLSVKNETYNLGNTTLIGFTDNATSGFDAGYDSPRLGSPVSIHSQLVDGSSALAIQGREAFNSAMTVGVGFSSLIEDEDAVYVISLAQTEGSDLANNLVYLRDLETGAMTNLNTAPYEFTSEPGDINTRFELLFKDATVLGSQDSLLSSIAMYPNPTNALLNIANPDGLSIDSIKVVDVLGRVLLSQNINATSKLHTFDISALKSATYMVLITADGVTTSKQLIKK